MLFPFGSIILKIWSTVATLHDAKARILRDGTICVSAQNVKRIVAVRYCFTNDAVANLFDVNGLPLAPFRTDIEK